MREKPSSEKKIPSWRGLRPKTREELQAQIETYADILDYRQALLYAEKLSETSDLTQIPKDLQEEVKFLFSKPIIKQYREVISKTLKGKGGKQGYSKEQIAFLASNAVEYTKKFASAIDELKRKIDENKDSKILPEFLGRGSASSGVYKITVEGQDLAAKFMNWIEKVGEYKAFFCARYIAHVVHLRAVSFKDGVIITDVIPGQSIKSIERSSDLADLPDFSDEELEAIIKSIVELRKVGIQLDPDPTNIFYDTKQGLGIIDYAFPNWVPNTSDEYKLTEDERILSRFVNFFEALGFSQRVWEILQSGQIWEQKKEQIIKWQRNFLLTQVRCWEIFEKDFFDAYQDCKRAYEKLMAEIERNDMRVGKKILPPTTWEQEFIPDQETKEYVARLEVLGVAKFILPKFSGYGDIYSRAAIESRKAIE